jgi:hypothetical protein
MINILDYGLNFIPTYLTNSFDLLSSIFFNFEQEFSALNKKLYILSSKKESTINNDISNLNLNVSQNLISPNLLSYFHDSTNPNSHPNHPLSLELKYNLLKVLSSLELNIKLNMNLNDILFLKKFKNENPFEVVQCDKNVGCAIISHELLNKLTMDHLSDIDTYKLIDIDPKETLISQINKKLSDLAKNKHIDKKLYKKLLINNDECKLGKIRILPKLHKNKFGIRPIINTTKHPTSKLCKLIEVILGPHVKKLPSYIQDSQNLIQDSYKLKIPINTKLVSADIESLYTNIQLEHAIIVICDFAKDKLPKSNLNITAFKEILKLVLENNYFSYKNNYYLQIKGIAMGCICGPTIANIVVHSLETNFLKKYLTFYYKRYIDDIFMIVNDDFDMSQFSNSFDYLKLNIESDTKITFLDLEISIDEILNKLNFSLHIKPTNTFSYLRTESNHPEFIFDNNPKSLLIRLRRICSNYNDFLYHSTLLIFRLIKRGYEYKKLIKIKDMVSKLNRDDLIPYKQKINKFADDTIFFKIPFELNLFNNDTKIKNFFKNNPIRINNKIVKIKIIHTTQPNLGSIFVHKFNIPRIKKFKNKPCDKKSCKICKFLNKEHKIYLNDQISFPILNNCTCDSKNGIYAIKCKLCNILYIGESKDIKRRIGYHIGTIKNFIPYIKYQDHPVAYHFNLKNHNFNTHFEFSIIKENIEDDIKRFNTETEIIHFIKQLVPNILNINIPKPPKYPQLFLKTN